MLRSYYSYNRSLSSATWHSGPVPRTHDFVTCRTRAHTRTHGLVPVPIPMISDPYPYPYPWPRTRTRTRTHDPYPKYKSAILMNLFTEISCSHYAFI